jgi:hypothetical protein
MACLICSDLEGWSPDFFLIYKYETRPNCFEVGTLKKNLGRSYPKKSQGAPYKNLR